MRKCEKSRLKKIRSHEKALRIVKKIRRLEQEKEAQGINTGTSGPLYYWCEVLSGLNKGDLRFIESYQARPGHLFAVEVFKQALNTVVFEKSAKLEKGE